MTYAALDRRATAMALWLQAAGVVPGTLVGLMLPRSLELIVGILGILKAGGAYVPIDPDYTETEKTPLKRKTHPTSNENGAFAPP